MYKLAHFKATNLIGFYSGLNKKTFDLDLHDMLDKDIITVIGGNAKGKTTFMSFIHPSHIPTDKRTKFIREGKEGTIVREYVGDDGSIIITKHVYSPKSDGGHSAKLFFTLIKPNDEEVELNPNGNVASYYTLVETYFGINKDYISFAAYNDRVRGIVDMTDTDRKNSVNTLIPNTKNYETAYNIVNDKYKDVRNQIRNLSQKIIALRDEDTVRAELKRTEKDITRYTADREDAVKKIAKADGKIKILTDRAGVQDLLDEYKKKNVRSVELSTDMARLKNKLHGLYHIMSIEPKSDDTITFDGIDEVKLRYEKACRRLEKMRNDLEFHERDIEAKRARLYDIENQLNENESVLYSLHTQSVDDLKKLLKGYTYRISMLDYTSHKDSYADMSYDESVSFINTLSMMENMVQSLFDTYGQLFSEYFINGASSADEVCMHGNQALLQTELGKRDEMYRRILQIEQYRGLQQILDKRPSDCVDDCCPFIAQALQWNQYERELEELNHWYEATTVRIDKLTYQIADANKRIQIQNDIKSLTSIIKSSEPLFVKYLGIDLPMIYQYFATSQICKVTRISDVKKIAAILSEKDLYINLTEVKIPEVKKSIELAKTSDKSRDMIMRTVESLKVHQSEINDDISNLERSIYINKTMIDKYETSTAVLSDIIDYINEYYECTKELLKVNTESDAMQEVISEVTELTEKIRKNKDELKTCNGILDDLVPFRERLKFALLQIIQLNEEKNQIEMDFMMLEVMRMVIQPGKGVWKEAINIYMADIHDIANQLLMNTFGGNLYLLPFEITDKIFQIPYVYNGSIGDDIAFASSSQRSTISTALSLAIISKMIDKYGIVTWDEVDKDLSPENREIFVDIMSKQAKYIGLNQCFVITHDPQSYEAHDVGYIVFPDAKFNKKGKDYIEIK